MTWHTEVVNAEHFQVLLDTVRGTGGTVTNSCLCPAGYSVTYVTLDDWITAAAIKGRPRHCRSRRSSAPHGLRMIRESWSLSGWKDAPTARPDLWLIDAGSAADECARDRRFRP
jgi:hypothetical protein